MNASLANIIPLTVPPQPAKAAAMYRQRFKIQEYSNPRTASKSWRVTGIQRDGTRVRENFAEKLAAECRQVDLTNEWLSRQTETAVRATKLTEEQLRLAEIAFARLDADSDLLLAVEDWKRHGKLRAVAVSPRLDEAVEQYLAWLAASPLRDSTKRHWRIRMNLFKNSVENHRVVDVTPEVIDKFLAGRNTSPSGKDTDRRAISRFFSWCKDRQRRWTTVNPCADVRVEMGEKKPPAVLTVAQCEALMSKADSFKAGRLAPYFAVCLFGGLRPFEAKRLAWEAVNLADGEIRLDGNQTKTGTPRVVAICDTLKAWLAAHKDKPFFPTNWRKDFDAVKEAAGYGRRSDDQPKLTPWIDDILRHTAISHYFRKTGSYGQTAEQFGNSEAIIKNHYQGRVSSDDTKKFYALRPKKGKRK